MFRKDILAFQKLIDSEMYPSKNSQFIYSEDNTVLMLMQSP